ncbi:hypothetical protein XCR1_1100014 [Xenorhabdus cabanillasii JM26]|uniref:Uncharacterized protein n=1 Tax=Xenorhabdus cabanillasii JM26 TaxID=1427517 RepID=W1IQ13_9GAMM|nr:hypothetical protein XCR1_1100014 [Xenorhabdus cabanillasii JM26]
MRSLFPPQKSQCRHISLMPLITLSRRAYGKSTISFFCVKLLPELKTRLINTLKDRIVTGEYQTDYSKYQGEIVNLNITVVFQVASLLAYTLFYNYTPNTVFINI